MTLPTEQLSTEQLHTEMATEAIPVVPQQGADHGNDDYRNDDYGDDVDEDFLDEDFNRPSQRSRMTMALIALLLVAVGFLGGVFVERTFGVSNAANQRSGGATTSGTARAPGGAGALGRL